LPVRLARPLARRGHSRRALGPLAVAEIIDRLLLHRPTPLERHTLKALIRKYF
jgi:hypothetical protein